MIERMANKHNWEYNSETGWDFSSEPDQGQDQGQGDWGQDQEQGNWDQGYEGQQGQQTWDQNQGDFGWNQGQQGYDQGYGGYEQGYGGYGQGYGQGYAGYEQGNYRKPASKVLTIIALILFFPLGIFMTWRTDWSRVVKIAITAVFGGLGTIVIILSIIGNMMGSDNSDIYIPPTEETSVNQSSNNNNDEIDNLFGPTDTDNKEDISTENQEDSNDLEDNTNSNNIDDEIENLFGPTDTDETSDAENPEGTEGTEGTEDTEGQGNQGVEDIEDNQGNQSTEGTEDVTNPPEEVINPEEITSIHIDNSEIQSNNSETIDIGEYEIGQTLTVNTSKGDFSIEFTSIEETNNRNTQADVQPTRVILLKYKVKNISCDSPIYVVPYNFKLYDYLGSELKQYYIDTNYGRPVSTGDSEDVVIAYGLNSAENVIKLEYYTNTSWGEKPKFEISIKGW